MDINAFARTIQFILAPVVMVTSCAVLLNGLLARYAVVNDRLRALGHERFELLVRSVTLRPAEPTPEKALVADRLGQIDTQLPLVLRRHQILRDGLLALYGSVLVFVLDMFVIATVVVANLDAVVYGTLGLFLLGNALLFVSVALVVVEVRGSHRAVLYEVDRLLKLSDGESRSAEAIARQTSEGRYPAE